METPTFKQLLMRDVHQVFLNPEELAELRTIRYDGAEYPDIPVSLQEPECTERQRLSASGFGRGGTDGAAGLHQFCGVLFCARSDLGGTVPKQGNSIQISTQTGGAFFRRYFVGRVGCEMGMLVIDLEGTGE